MQPENAGRRLHRRNTSIYDANYEVIMKSEFVYAITIGSKTKVGMTSSPKDRVDTIIRGAGATREECEVTVVSVSNKSACESAAHEMLSGSRVVGEWFRVCHQRAVEAIRAANQATERTPRSKKIQKELNSAEMELMAMRVFCAKARADMDTAAFELSRYGDVDPIVAASIASAAYLDDSCFVAALNGNPHIRGKSLDMINAIHDHLKSLSINMLLSGDGVNSRIAKLCNAETNSIASSYLQS